VVVEYLELNPFGRRSGPWAVAQSKGRDPALGIETDLDLGYRGHLIRYISLMDFRGENCVNERSERPARR
jgi:hypothetical protein